jgi:hypothetical protein
VGTDERDHRVRRAGAGEALFAFLEPAPQAVGAEPLLCFDADGMMVLTHEGLLQIAAEVLRRRSPGACAIHPGLGGLSAGDLETGLFDLDQEIAGEAGLDAERALDPLPRLGDDILVEPLARRFVQRPDQDDRLFGSRSCQGFPSERDAPTPIPRTARGHAGVGFSQAASFINSPAARSISSRLSLLGIERACAVAATVTSQRVSIGRSSSTW